MSQTPASLQALRSSVRLTKIHVGLHPDKKVFETELRFILREPQSKLARAVTQPTSTAPVSFERSPKHFPAILEYLSCPTARSWAVTYSQEESLLQFLDEAEFYGLEGLKKDINLVLYDARRVNVYVGIGREHVTIGSAIAACSAGQRVLVEPGTYEEHLEITKDVAIIALKAAVAPVPPSAAAGAPRARGAKHLQEGTKGVVVQFASNSVISVSGSVFIENVTIRRILRTGFDRKNVIVDLQEEAVTRDNTTEVDGAAVVVIGGGSIKMEACRVMSQTGSMMSIEAGCSVSAHHCAFDEARGNGITCRGSLNMRSCGVSHCTDCAVVMELGSLDMQHCTLSSRAARSCLISRHSAITCTHTTFSGCTGPCIQLECTGALTADVFAACMQAQSPSSSAPHPTATLPHNGFDPASIALLHATLQSMVTAAPASIADLRSMTVQQLKAKLVTGEALLKNCVVRECGSMGLVCCGGSVRLIEVSLHACPRLAVLVQDNSKLTLSSCRIVDSAGCAVWARSQSLIMAVGLRVEGSGLSAFVIDGFASVRLVDCDICSSGRSAVSLINGTLHVRDARLSRNKHCAVETCADETCALLLRAAYEDLRLFVPVVLPDADATAPRVSYLELQACSVTGNGDGVIIESKRAIFDSEPTFSHVEFVGNMGHGCLLSTACCNPVFRHCVFRDNVACGVRFESNGKGMLSNCSLENNGSCGVHVHGQGSFCSIRDCDIRRHAVAGLIFEEWCRAEVKEARVVGNSIAVITMSNAAPSLTRCTFSGCSATAMVCGPNSAGKYDECVFSENKGLAVSIESAARPHVQGCSFCPAADNMNAITCCPGSEGNISNCTFDGVGSIAVALQRDADVRVAHCSIKGCSQFGILCMPGAKGCLECGSLSHCCSICRNI
jgi:hypothetical protein